MSRANKRGFTLIEIMLAMAFISFLLLAIAMIVIQISQVYNRGLTFKEVNQMSRSLSDNLLRDVSASAPFSLGADDHNFVNTPGVGGRLCLGQYSYVWNYGKGLVTGNSGVVAYDDDSELRLARIADATGSYCAVGTDGILVKKRVEKTRATELMNSSDHNLVVHDVTITTSSTATDLLTNQQLYTITFSIGTNDQAALKQVGGRTVCQEPGDANPDLEYCVVQQFTLVARAQNAVN